MAINPGADLLTDALAAADPQRAKAAEERLARLAAGNAEDGLAPAEFQATLALEAASLTRSGAVSAVLSEHVSPVKTGNPYEQFEAAVLKSLFEFMLPAQAPSVFGAGFAGDVWKSMLADALAAQAGQAGIAGIARTLEARKSAVKPGSRSKNA